MGCIDSRGAGIALSGDQFLEEHTSDVGVQMRGRLVEEIQGRLPGQRTGQAHPLLFPPGQLGRMAFGEMTDVQPLQDPLRLRPRMGALFATPAGGIGDGVERSEVRPQGVVLEHHGQLAPFRRNGTGRA